MRKKYVRLTSYAALWAPRLGSFSLLVLLASILSHRFSLIKTFDFFIFVGVAGVCATISVILSLKGLYDLWQNASLGGLKSIKGLIYATLTLLPLGFFIALWFIMPPLYDISTDTDTPPDFISDNRPSDALKIEPTLSKQTAMQLTEWPQLSGRRYDGSPDRIMASVLNVLTQKGWPVVARSGNSGDYELYIQTQIKTLYLGFFSDIIIRLTDEGDTTFVDMRASSRYLTRDLGIDANFIMTFMEVLDIEMLLTPISQDAE